MAESSSISNEKDNAVEHCSTGNRQLKRIINRCHVNPIPHQSFVDLNDVSYSDYLNDSSIDYRICSSIGCVTKSVDVPNVSCASLGSLYVRNLTSEGIKKHSFTEKIALFASLFVNQVILSEVLIVWMLYYVFSS
jgi:hypothetical protein